MPPDEQAVPTSATALSVNTAVIQARVTGACAVGSSIRAIAADGTVTCQTDTTGGTITGVAAGTGLSGGGTTGSVSLAIAAGGVGTTELAASSVTTAKIIAGAVTMSKTDIPIGYAAATQSGSFIYPSGSEVSFAENGSCFVTAQAFNTTTNSSFQIRPTMNHVATNNSVNRAEYGPSWFANSQSGNGYFGEATAVLATNAIGNWRFGCEFVASATTNMQCRVSWICN